MRVSKPNPISKSYNGVSSAGETHGWRRHRSWGFACPICDAYEFRHIYGMNTRKRAKDRLYQHIKTDHGGLGASA